MEKLNVEGRQYVNTVHLTHVNLCCVIDGYKFKCCSKFAPRQEVLVSAFGAFVVSEVRKLIAVSCGACIQMVCRTALILAARLVLDYVHLRGFDD